MLVWLCGNGVGIVPISAAFDANVITTIVSIAVGFPLRVTVTPVSLWVQAASPPVSAEQDRIIAGRAGSARVGPDGLRIWR
jgi:hypothetical protein